MNDNTFNLSILFDGGRALGTIVCYSDSQIDRARVQWAVNQKLYMMIQSGEMNQPPKKIVETLAGFVQHVCPGLQAVIVPSDACVMIQRAPLRQNPENNSAQNS